ncbi:MAG: 6-carboxytetrahydropterin synthase [Planctomycetota bacterium]
MPRYRLTVRDEFCAAHALRIAGQIEPTHGHNWRVTLAVAGDQLDDDKLLCDFHAVERALRAVIDPFRNADLSNTPPFDTVNATAEAIAEHIADSVAQRLEGSLPPGVMVESAAVTEAPGCEAIFFMPT